MSEPPRNPWPVAVAVMSSAVMEVLDTTVVNVSLPHIAGSLSATVDEATWVLTSYLVANAVILPITGWLANYFGRKRLLMTVVTGFTVSSALCGIGAEPPAPDPLPRAAGHDGRRPATPVSGRPAGGIPLAGTRQGHGLLGPSESSPPRSWGRHWGGI